MCPTPQYMPNTRLSRVISGFDTIKQWAKQAAAAVFGASQHAVIATKIGKKKKRGKNIFGLVKNKRYWHPTVWDCQYKMNLYDMNTPDSRRWFKGR